MNGHVEAATTMESATAVPMMGGGETVGRSLKRAREEKNLSLDEVSRATKIKKEFLIAIEEDRFDALPGQVFTRGFIRAYGDFLGLDGQQAALKAVRSLEGEIPSVPGSSLKAAGGMGWAFVVGGIGAAAAVLTWIAMST